MNNLSPILLFTYKRIETLKKTVEALKHNFLAESSVLFIYSDGFKNEKDKNKVQVVRDYIKNIEGFKSVTIFESLENKGLANSIIGGASQIINEYGKVIVLEDDLVTSPNFLDFMNKALNFYENNKDVFSIAGYTCPLKNITDDIYFTKRAASWGWATWKDRWENIDWEVKDYETFKSNLVLKRKFNKMGSDMSKMLIDQMTGKINSWAIRWCYSQFKQDKFTLYPTHSKVLNIGTGLDASNTKDSHNRFYTTLDSSDRRDFEFINSPRLESKYLKQFLKQFSIYTRIKYKLLNLLG